MKSLFAQVVGTGHYVPERVLTNDDLATMVETSDEWIRSRTGIVERHIAGQEESASSMAKIGLSGAKIGLQKSRNALKWPTVALHGPLPLFRDIYP